MHVPMAVARSSSDGVGTRYGTSVPLQRVTSLRRHAQANAPAASNWLRCVLNDDGRRDRLDEPIVQKVPGAEPAMHR